MARGSISTVPNSAHAGSDAKPVIWTRRPGAKHRIVETTCRAAFAHLAQPSALAARPVNRCVQSESYGRCGTRRRRTRIYTDANWIPRSVRVDTTDTVLEH